MLMYSEKRHSMYDKVGVPAEHKSKADLVILILLCWFLIPLVMTIFGWVFFLGCVAFILSAVLAIFYPERYQQVKEQIDDKAAKAKLSEEQIARAVSLWSSL